MTATLTDGRLANLIMPFEGGALLLPNYAVVEASMAENLRTEGATDLLPGRVSWRELDIPLVQFAALLGGEVRARPPRQVAVLNGLLDRERLSYFALSLTGVPRLVVMSETDIELVERAPAPAIHSTVRYLQQTLIVPNWDVMERAIIDNLFAEV